jgi:uncharacterized SAM-binding protein YcdF (DUF218 family)
MERSPLQSVRKPDLHHLPAGLHPPKGDRDVVVALAFGTGVSNVVLARIAMAYSALLGSPIICQKEVRDHLDADGRGVDVEVIRGREGMYLDTYRALVETKAICEKRGWTKVLLVAHPDHISRAALEAQRLGLDVDTADVAGVPYDSSSAQWWTRNRLLFKVWDLGARFFSFLRILV